MIEVFAPAKVNLYLHVTGRRADGYHLLDSLVVFAGVGDSVAVAPAEQLSLTLDGPTAAGLKAEPDNMVLKAARRLAELAGIAPHAAIHLTKRLPVASGIGGGSTDGAAALRALCRLWNLSPGADELAQLGLGLGADLPVCLRARPTAMSGIGELLAETPALPPAWLLLVNPGIALATPPVFKARVGPFSAPAPLRHAPADAAALATALAQRGNDLTAPAVALAPAIGTVLEALAAQPGCLLPRMSGSGATCFGLFADAEAAQTAAAALSAAQPGWWVAAGAVLN